MTIEYDRDRKSHEKEDQGGRRRGASHARSMANVARVAVDAAAMGGSSGSVRSSQLDEASTVGMMIGLAESVEEGLTQSDVDARMERFPELRDLELASGAAGRFPELGETPASAPVEEDEIDLRR